MEYNPEWKPNLNGVSEVIDCREDHVPLPVIRLAIESTSSQEVKCYMEDAERIHYRLIREESGIIAFFTYGKESSSRDNRLKQLAMEKTGVDITSSRNSARDINEFWGAYDEMRSDIRILTDYIDPDDDMKELSFRIGWSVFGDRTHQAHRIIFENMALNPSDLQEISQHFGVSVDLLITPEFELYSQYHL